jgi:plasmid stabilization system protein ParE
MPYRLSTLAEQDLDAIWSYVAEDASPATADRLIDAIIDRFELLAEQPRMGRLRPEFGEGVRSFTVEKLRHLLPSRARRLGSQVAAWPSRPDRRMVGT